MFFQLSNELDFKATETPENLLQISFGTFHMIFSLYRFPDGKTSVLKLLHSRQ
jgi:hypothetical protein